MILLDTHALLWLLADDARLGSRARQALGEGEVYFSVASIWELSIKHSLGRIDAPGPVVEAARRSGLRELAVDADHALAVAASPLAHGDPFDRLLVAQAEVERARFLTPDRAILAAGLSYVVDARP